MKTKHYLVSLIALVATLLAITPAQAQFQIGSDGLKFGINEKESTSKQKERKVRWHVLLSTEYLSTPLTSLRQFSSQHAVPSYSNGLSV